MDANLRTLATRRYLIAALLTFLVATIQLVAYYFLGAQSLSLFADTFHAGSDGIALLLTGYLLRRGTFFLIGTERAHRAFTLANIALLLMGVALSAKEILEHYALPPTPTSTVIVIVIFGGAGDIVIRRVLRSIPRDALPATLRTNHEVNLLHITQDVWMSWAVALSAVLIALGYAWFDLIAGSAITFVIGWEAIGLLYKETTGKRFPFRLHHHDDDCDHRH